MQENTKRIQTGYKDVVRDIDTSQHRFYALLERLVLLVIVCAPIAVVVVVLFKGTGEELAICLVGVLIWFSYVRCVLADSLIRMRPSSNIKSTQSKSKPTNENWKGNLKKLCSVAFAFTILVRFVYLILQYPLV